MDTDFDTFPFLPVRAAEEQATEARESSADVNARHTSPIVCDDGIVAAGRFRRSAL